MKNLQPFDLETALAHPERVVTRDGRKLCELTFFKSITGRYPLIGLIENEESISTFMANGVRLFGHKGETDLFILPEVKECWVNVYENKINPIYIGGTYKSEELAKSNISKEITYIKTIRITNEPE